MLEECHLHEVTELVVKVVIHCPGFFAFLWWNGTTGGSSSSRGSSRKAESREPTGSFLSRRCKADVNAQAEAF